MKELLTGVQAALVTPFESSRLDNINLGELESHCLNLISSGVLGLVPCGTTGETPTLTHAECVEVISTVTKVCRGTSTKVIAGTGSNSTIETVRMTEKAAELGADAALIVAPYYNRPTSTGVLRHFREIDRIGLPLIIYNIPSRTGINLDPNLIEAIVDSCPNVIGLKASNGNLDEMIQIAGSMNERADNFSLLSGDDSLTVPIMSIGGSGVVSVAANIIPKTMCLLVARMQSGDYPAARRISWAIHDFVRRLLSVGSNPEPIKSIMNAMGISVGECRLPLTNISPEFVECLQRDLARIRSILGADLSPDAVFEEL